MRNAVQVAFGQVFECPITANSQQNLITVEGAFAQAAAFKLIGGRFQQAHAFDGRFARGGIVRKAL